MTNVLKWLVTLILVACAVTAKARECADAKSCEFYLNEHGDLMRGIAQTTAPVKLFVGDGGASMAYENYVIVRSGKYYIVRESSGNDKSFIIVPLNVSGDNVGFDRVLYFSLEMQKSAESGYDVWSGEEIALKKQELVADFSWSRIVQLQDKIKNTVDGNVKPVSQSGFHVAAVNMYDLNGNLIGRRAYLYPDKLGATPESIVCFANCPKLVSSAIIVLRGGIGKYPITLIIKNDQNRVTGSYSYDGKIGALQLDGAIIGGRLSLIEHAASMPAKTTGEFNATLSDSVYVGTWASGAKGGKLPFFAVMDAL